MSNDAATLKLLDDIVDAFNAHDVEAVVRYFAEDGVMLLAAGPGPAGASMTGNQELREGLSARFAAVPDIRWKDGKSWVFGDKAHSEWHVQGTLPDGTKLDCPGCDLWEFSDGMVVKKDTYYKQVTG